MSQRAMSKAGGQAADCFQKAKGRRDTKLMTSAALWWYLHQTLELMQLLMAEAVADAGRDAGVNLR